MKFRFVLFAVLGLLCSMLTAQAQSPEGYWQEVQQRGVLRCGAAIAPPHVIRDPLSGEYSGLFVDFCKEFGEKVLGVKVEMVETTWDNMIAGLQASRWDLAMAINRQPKRALSITFSEPLWNYEISLAYDKANPKVKTPVSLADVDIAGMNIGVKTGSAEDILMTSNIKNATILRLTDTDAVRLALSSHRVDLAVEDSDANALFLATDKARWVAFKPVPAVAKQGVGFGLRRTASAADVMALNIFIEEKAATGQTNDVFKAYVDKVVGGVK